jgi:pimeloyl-ACP methyl ester carboxylesterase
MTLPKQAASIAAALHARTVVLDGGHALMSEAPDGILSALRAALAETAPA